LLDTRIKINVSTSSLPFSILVKTMSPKSALCDSQGPCSFSCVTYTCNSISQYCYLCCTYYRTKCHIFLFPTGSKIVSLACFLCHLIESKQILVPLLYCSNLLDGLLPFCPLARRKAFAQYCFVALPRYIMCCSLPSRQFTHLPFVYCYQLAKTP
jgi:hypothetical protein